jgi:hypothetical protein
MDLELLTTYIIVGLIFFFIGWKAREIRAFVVIDKMVKDISENSLEEFKENIINIRVERHDGKFFIYERDDGSYLAHGETRKMLEDILNERFPGKMFNASEEDIRKLNT